MTTKYRKKLMSRRQLRAELDRAELQASRLAIALHHTQEYVGPQTLPPIPGWSWFDALNDYWGKGWHDAMLVERQRAIERITDRQELPTSDGQHRVTEI